MSDLRYGIDLDGIDEVMRCIICQNPMHTDRGCDGNCQYNEAMYKRIMQELDSRIKRLPYDQPEPHWIPCSEGLPKEEGFYLVTIEFKHGAETTIRFFRIENGERYWSLWGNENITAWMPKPEPYKGVTE